MKRFVCITLFLLGTAFFVSAEVRLDLGFDIPRGLGGLASGEIGIDEDAADVLNTLFFPFPEAGIYYQSAFGPVRIGGGARAFTLILETILWPNLYVEADLWKFTGAFQLGGLFFGMFGLFTTAQSGAVLIPDLSLWFRIGNTFRLGAGAMGFMLPDLSDNIVFVYYFGAKFALSL